MKERIYQIIGTVAILSVTSAFALAIVVGQPAEAVIVGLGAIAGLLFVACMLLVLWS